MLRRCALGFTLFARTRAALSSQLMRIFSWARLAPSLSPISGRSAVTTMAAQAPEWAGLLKEGIARHKNDPTAKYCQLATAAVGGGASCRTWVFRGFYEDKGALKFITDRRSQKIPEIEADPVGEVCFYLKKTREQFRIKGRLQVVYEGESDEVLAKARRHQWTQISPTAQASFATSLIPGLEIPPAVETPPSEGGGDSGSEKDTAVDERSNHPRGGGNRKDTNNADAGHEVEPSQEPVSEDFCLVLLWPNFVDHLQLGDRQLRNVHQIKGGRDGGGTLSAASAIGVEVGQAGREPGIPVAWVTMAVNP